MDVFNNMFVSGDHLMVCRVQLDTPANEFHDAMMKQPVMAHAYKRRV